jgi:hypothetical protein
VLPVHFTYIAKYGSIFGQSEYAINKIEQQVAQAWWLYFPIQENVANDYCNTSFS